MKKAAFLVAIICMMTMHSCKKNNNPVVNVNAALKAAFNYMPGTYWIYKDSISGRVDSFFVTRQYDITGIGASVTIEYVFIYISEYDEDSTSSFDTVGWLLTCTSNEIDLNFVTKKDFAGSINYAPLIDYPFLDPLESDGYTEGNEDSAEVSILSDYTVNGRNFSNVGVVNEHVNHPPFLNYGLYTTNDWFYICPEAGIIKMRLNHPQDSLNRVWELQKWHIVK